MSALNLIHCGRIGCESRSLSRRAHHVELQSEPLEYRRLLSTGLSAAPDPNAAVAAGSSAAPAIASSLSGSAARPRPAPPSSTAPVSGPTTPTQAILPTDNSSTTNTPGVSLTVPSTFNTAADGSNSVGTAPETLITAFIPNTSPFITSVSQPVYIVPMQTSGTMELSIETLGFQTSTSPSTLQASNQPVILHPINAPPPQVHVLAHRVGEHLPPPLLTPSEHIGQAIETELQKPLKLKLGPQPEQPKPVDIVGPPFEPSEPAGPKAEPPKEQTQPEQHAPLRGMSPQWWPSLPLPIPAPMLVPVPLLGNQGELPAAPADASPEAMRSRTDSHVGLSALFGVVAVAGGMSEAQRFGLRWQTHVAAPRTPLPARPRVPALRNR